MDVQTRSLSASIVDFFKKPAENREQDDKEIGNDVRRLEEVTLPDGQGSLILYETDSQLRPPVLPILPVQRLRLLRHKQELRRRQGLDVLLAASGSRNTPRLSLMDSSYSRERSSTPSPVKAAGTAEPVGTLRVLKSRKVGNSQREGTRWSGSFDYDLSEYDNHRKEGKPVTNVVRKDHIDSPSITATKMAAPPGGLFQDINSSSLSAAQRDILLKGQPTSAARQRDTILAGSNQGDATDAKQEKDKTVPPSIGFDFIKPNDTPSKAGDLETIKMRQKTQEAEKGSFQFKPVEQPSEPAAAKPSFNFTNLKSNIDHRPREDENETEEPRRKKAARLFTGTTTSPDLKSSSSGQDNNKPTFSFGNAAAGSAVTGTTNTSAEKKEVSQPLFKFGKPKEDKEKEEKSKSTNTVPSFSFGAKQSDQVQLNGSSLGNNFADSGKTAFSFGNGPKSAAQGSKIDKSCEKASDEAAQAPIFKFSAGNKTADVSKTSSAIDQGAVDNKKDSSTSTAFSFGPSIAPGSKDKPAAPSFTFGSSKTSDKETQPVAAPSFSIGGSTTSGKEDKAPNATPSFSFGAAAEKKGTSAASSFSFGKSAESDNKDKVATPSFSFGKSAEPDNKNKAAAPSFSFGKPVEINNKDQPSATPSSFGSSVASDNKEKAQTPPFSFGSSVASDNKEKAQAPSFSFGNGPSLEKKDQPSTAPSFTFGPTNRNDSRAAASLPTNGFTFEKPSEGAEGDAQKPSFSFGVTDAAKSGGSVFGTSSAQTNPAPMTNNTSFTFNKPSTLAGGNNTFSNLPGAVNKAGSPSLDFKFGAATNDKNTTVATAPTTSVTNPFLGTSQNSNNGFSFNISGNANSNAPAFGQTQPSQTAFGTTPSPAFGRSASPIVMNGSNSSSRAFTPSSTINMNFSNNATVNPSSIFSGQPDVPNMAASGQPQLFGTAPPPSQIFGAGPQNHGMAPAQLAQPAQQTPAMNFQLPPGRKLARMRQSRR